MKVNKLMKGLKEKIKRLFSGDYSSSDIIPIINSDGFQKVMKKQWEENTPVDQECGWRMWSEIEQKTIVRSKSLSVKVWSFTAAASIIVLFVLGSLAYYFFEPEFIDKEINVYAASPMELQLPDKSTIWLGSGTNIAYHKDFKSNRDLKLRGNAVFEVRKNNGQPFRVFIGKSFIEVKGTVFSVSTINDVSSQISLISGKIDFHTNNTIITMSPQQQIRCNSNGDILMKDIPGIHWQEGKYRLENVALSDLIKFVNNINPGALIKLKTEKEIDNRFTGYIKYDESIEDIAEKICYSLKLSFRRVNYEIIIY